MTGFLTFAVLLAVGALIVGVVRPAAVRLASRRQVALGFGGVLLALLLALGATDPTPAPPSGPPSNAATVAAPSTTTPPAPTPPAPTPPQAAPANVTPPAPAAEASTAPPGAGKPLAAPGPVASATPTLPVADPTLFTVVAVVDGDTLKVASQDAVETLRLIGMDTPETKDPRKPVQCFGAEAAAKAAELLSGRQVRLEADPTQGERDKYGRLLRYVWRADGLFFNEWMIRNGYAHEYTYATPYRYQADFRAAQHDAADHQRGLWNPATCAGDTDQPALPATATAPSATADHGHTFYTSSYPSARYYYCDTDSGWRSLSATYRTSFPSATALRAAYPTRTLHAPCDG